VVTSAFDIERRRVMKKPVEGSCHQDMVIETLASIEKALVGGGDETAALIATHDQLKEQVQVGGLSQIH